MNDIPKQNMDQDKLIHELEVHQIELESQNEQLKRTQEELEVLHSKYFDLYNLAPVGYLTLNEKGIIVEANLTACSMLGISRNILISQPISKWIFKEDQDLYYKYRLNASKTDAPQLFEIRLQNIHNTVFWACFKIVIYTDENNIVNYYISFIDTTEIKNDEHVYKNLYLNSQIGLFRTDLETGLLVDANEKIAEIFGFKDRNEMLSKPFYVSERYIDLEERKRLISIIKTYGKFQDFEASLKRNDGSILLVRFSGRLNKEKKWIEGVAEDITGHKKMENALITSETRYRRLFETAKDGIIILDSDSGIIIDVNPFLIEMLGFSKEEFLNKYIWDIGIFKNIVESKEKFLELQQKGYIRYENLPLETFDRREVDVEFVSNVYSVNSHKVIQCNIRNITDRVKAEELLKESEEKFSTAFKTSPYAITITDKTGKIMEVNDAFYKISGYNSDDEELSSLNLWENLEDRDNVIKELFSKEQVSNRIYNFKSKTGETIVGVFSAYLMHIKDEVFILSSINDITEIKKSEKLLQESEEKYRMLIENLNEGIWVIDKDSNTTFVNKKLCEMFGYGCEEMIGKPLFSFMEEKEVKDANMRIEKRKEGVSEYHDFEFIKKDGTKLYTSIGTAPMFDSDNNYNGAIAALQDITDRRKMEVLLRENEERLRDVLENSTDSAYKRNLLTDSYDYMSPVFFRITGITPEEMKYIPIEDLKKNIHPDDLANTEKVMFESSVDPSKNTNQLEYRFKHKNGNWIWLQDRFTIIRDSSGDPCSIIGNVTDITETKKLLEEHIEMQRELFHTQKLKSLGIMAGGIAHDFNNLLTIIIGNISLALMDKNNSSEAIICLDDSLKASHRAADLIRQMLAYSGKGRFVIQQMNLSKLVEENIHIFRSSIPTTTDLNFDLPDVRLIPADVSQVQQVIMNLITNASEAIGNEIGAITITTGMKTFDEKDLSLSVIKEKPSPGEFVYVEVVDTGCGMTEETQKQMFDPFFTTKFTGRGLGMSALQGIIRGHGGAIFVNSKVDVGTTIRALLPVSMEAKTQTIESVGELMTFNSSPHVEYILIVDDEEYVRNICSKMIEALGYPTLTASNGLDAIEIFKKRNKEIICVLLDLTMPKMDGYHTFKELKDINPEVKVILSSGYNEQFVTQNLTGSGLAGFLQKPYTIEKLNKKIKEVLEK